MNERIRELLEQAGFDVKRLLEPYPGGFPREDMLALESFAELIVRECFKAAMIESKGHMNPIDLKKRMKERVGVSE